MSWPTCTSISVLIKGWCIDITYDKHTQTSTDQCSSQSGRTGFVLPDRQSRGNRTHSQTRHYSSSYQLCRWIGGDLQDSANQKRNTSYEENYSSSNFLAEKGEKEGTKKAANLVGTGDGTLTGRVEVESTVDCESKFLLLAMKSAGDWKDIQGSEEITPPRAALSIPNKQKPTPAVTEMAVSSFLPRSLR